MNARHIISYETQYDLSLTIEVKISSVKLKLTKFNQDFYNDKKHISCVRLYTSTYRAVL